jgi:succinate dehydrogenase / fumarate reductase cytochrome b subunit
VAERDDMKTLTADERHFLLRRIHSLTGIVPIGGFLLFHFFENASARRGEAAFNATVEKISQMPYIYALEIGLLLIPILFHSIYGLYITASARPNVVHYPYGRNWSYTLQRISGIVAFFYLAYHVATTRIWSLFVKGSDYAFADMVASLSSTTVLLIYVIGIVAATFHFANGIWSFSITWGIVTSAAAQKRLACATNVFFVILCVVGLDILSAFKLDGGFLAKLGGLIF